SIERWCTANVIALAAICFIVSFYSTQVGLAAEATVAPATQRASLRAEVPNNIDTVMARPSKHAADIRGRWRGTRLVASDGAAALLLPATLSPRAILKAGGAELAGTTLVDGAVCVRLRVPLRGHPDTAVGDRPLGSAAGISDRGIEFVFDCSRDAIVELSTV